MFSEYPKFFSNPLYSEMNSSFILEMSNNTCDSVIPFIMKKLFKSVICIIEFKFLSIFCKI